MREWIARLSFLSEFAPDTLNNYKRCNEVQEGIAKLPVQIFPCESKESIERDKYDSRQFFAWHNNSTRTRGRGNIKISRIILSESPYRWRKSAGSRNARTIMTRRIEASFLPWPAIQSPVLRFPVFRIAGGITTWEAAFSHVLLGRSPMEDRDEPGCAHIPCSQRALKLQTSLENLAKRQK